MTTPDGSERQQSEIGAYSGDSGHPARLKADS